MNETVKKNVAKILVLVGPILLVLLLIGFGIALGIKEFKESKEKKYTQYTFYDENLNIITDNVSADHAQEILLALETTGIVLQMTKLDESDIIRYDEKIIDIFMGLTVRILLDFDSFRIYTWEKYYSDKYSILIYDSTNKYALNLNEDERKSLYYTQRQYAINSIIQITPSTGILQHNLLGNTQLEFDIKNVSDTTFDNVYLTFTPIMWGSDLTHANKGYSVEQPIHVGENKHISITTSDWYDYDHFIVAKIIIIFADNTSIGFSSFDCQFLNNSGELSTSIRDSIITYHLYSDTKIDEKFYSKFGVLLAEPTREGYKFCGWYDNKDLKGNQITYLPCGTTGQISLYAKWELLND